MEEKLLAYVRLNMPKAWALVAGLVLGIIILASVDGLFEKAITDVWLRFSGYGILLLGWVYFWEHYRSCIRRTKKGKTGVVISIAAEDAHEEQRLKADFISRFRERIAAENLGDTIDLIVVNNHQAGALQKGEGITKANKRVRASYYIWGSIKRRNHPNTTYFLSMNGTVFHVPINQQNRAQLVQDMDAVIAKQVQFPEALEFQGFQYSADSSYTAVRYILGIAAYISGNPELAQKMHVRLETDLQATNPLPPNLAQVKNKLPNLLSDELLFRARLKHDEGDLASTKTLLGESIAKNPSNYAAKIFLSIIDFLHDNDPAKSLSRLKSALKDRKQVNDDTIFYNLAFLQLWIGDYQAALRTCDRILKANDSDATAIESEQFNLRLLEEGKLKTQMYFWLGFLNYRKQRNFPQADKYFTEFVNKAEAGMETLVARAKEYQTEIRKEIGY